MNDHIMKSERLHIGFFGRCNSGKSSLMNALTGQQVSIVSAVPGTTTDTVPKNIELPGVGACVLLDTAGYDDADDALGQLRIEQTKKIIDRLDLAVVVTDHWDGAEDEALVQQWQAAFRLRKIPVVWVLNKVDGLDPHQLPVLRKQLSSYVAADVVCVSALTHAGIKELIAAMARKLVQKDEIEDLTGSLATEGDTVVLVMPQDLQAPKGRLILPQVQTIRNLLDKKCLVMSCTADRLPQMLQALAAPPRLIITDSQVFRQVYALCPSGTQLTSFSVLFARYKGDAQRFRQGAQELLHLPPQARILIAEACSHVPQNEDIGRVKLPRMLRQRLGDQIRIDIVSGHDYPEDLTPYDMVIHCGACMFTRTHVLARMARACQQHVSITNYGMAIAALQGILPDVAIPD